MTEKKKNASTTMTKFGLWMFFSFSLGFSFNQSYHYARDVNNALGATTFCTGIDYIDDVHHSSQQQQPLNFNKKYHNSSRSTNSNSNKTIIYGHLHFAKTAGTNLNWRLAGMYDNVCGNKGYSYDSYERNQRIFSKRKEKNRELSPSKSDRYDVKSIGIENCDYISHEGGYKMWTDKIVKKLNFHDRNFVLELHVPCRDPIDHLLSICNHCDRKFKCVGEIDNNDDDDDKTNSTEQELLLEQEIKNCLWSGGRHDRREVVSERPKMLRDPSNRRFHPTALQNNPNIDLRCFRPLPSLSSYVNYMDRFLRRRKIEVPSSMYPTWGTNKQRNKSSECLLSNSTSNNDRYLERIRNFMKSTADVDGYFSFCNDCLGSSKELQLSL